MFTNTSVAMLAKTEDLMGPGANERLRRAGYHDGERRPRLRHHWANLTSARHVARRLRDR